MRAEYNSCPPGCFGIARNVVRESREGKVSEQRKVSLDEPVSLGLQDQVPDPTKS